MSKIIKYYREYIESIGLNDQIGFIHKNLNPENLFHMSNEDEKSISFGIIGFLRVNVSFYLYDLAICMWRFIVFIITKAKLQNCSIDDIKITNLRIMAQKIIHGYKNLINGVDNYQLKFLYWSILYTLSMSIIDDELDYLKQSTAKTINFNYRRFIDNCWFLFENLFLNEHFLFTFE